MDAFFPVPDLAAYFAGEWSLEREIRTGGGEDAGQVTGVATFTEDDGVLVYVEEGELALGAHSGPFRRELHYRLSGPGRADVHFDHGGFFHDLDLRTGRWHAVHPCRADDYRGEYRTLTADGWRQVWRVTGPAKNHVILSRFTRA